MHLAADALRHDEDAPGDQVAVAVSPDRKLQIDAALELVERGERLESRMLL